MALSMPVPNGQASTLSVADQEIILDYNTKTYAVTVTPAKVSKGETICFKGTNGAKVRVIFVSPFGDELLEMADSETRKLSVGGFYPFKCFFTPKGGKEMEGKTGGVLDVGPTRP